MLDWESIQERLSARGAPVPLPGRSSVGKRISRLSKVFLDSIRSIISSGQPGPPLRQGTARCRWVEYREDPDWKFGQNNTGTAAQAIEDAAHGKIATRPVPKRLFAAISAVAPFSYSALAPSPPEENPVEVAIVEIGILLIYCDAAVRIALQKPSRRSVAVDK